MADSRKDVGHPPPPPYISSKKKFLQIILPFFRLAVSEILSQET